MKGRNIALIIIIILTGFVKNSVRAQKALCSFQQLSLNKRADLIREIEIHPTLLKVEYLDIPGIDVDTSLAFKNWSLNDSLKIVQKVPNDRIRDIQDSTTDTLIINKQKFCLDRIVKESINAIVRNIYTFNIGNDHLLCLKIINGWGGRILNCNLLVFNITDTNHVVCLNEISNVAGKTWMVKENLITDLDNDGVLELNLVDDNLELRPYLIYPSELVKSNKYFLQFHPNSDLKFCVDEVHSNWYFDIGKNLKKCGTCEFNFNENYPKDSYK